MTITSIGDTVIMLAMGFRNEPVNECIRYIVDPPIVDEKGDAVFYASVKIVRDTEKSRFFFWHNVTCIYDVYDESTWLWFNVSFQEQVSLARVKMLRQIRAHRK